MNNKIKVLILLLYAILTGFCIYGCLKMKKYFSMRLFLNEEFDEYRFHQMEMKYYQHHYKPVIYVELDDDIDFFSEET